MAATKFDLLIWQEDETEPGQVVADQRDLAAFEVEFKMGFTRALDEMQITLFRFIAWHALRRTGKIDTKLKRSDWDAKVVEVEPAPNDDQSVDPGSPAASEETS